LNRRPADYKSAALPTELRQHFYFYGTNLILFTFLSKFSPQGFCLFFLSIFAPKYSDYFVISKNELKETASLLQKKHRNEKSKFIVEGRKLISEALSSGFVCELIISTNHFNEVSEDFFQDKNIKSIRHETAKQVEFEKLSDTKTPQGVIGVFQKKEIRKAVLNSDIIVALENISDPGNLGTILRNADWFGFRQIILSENCAEIYSPKVIRSSAGSVFHLDIFEEENFFDSLRELKRKNYKIFTADLDGKNVYELESKEKCIVVFCNEGNGPTNELLAISDSKITIRKIGKAESLNVASASAIILSELSR
jgi:RNA methyltransferase, TrmH family